MKRIITDFDGIWNPLGWVEGMTPFLDMEHRSFTDITGDTTNIYVSPQLLELAHWIAEHPDVEFSLLSSWNRYVNPETFTQFGFPAIVNFPSSHSGHYMEKVLAVLDAPDNMSTLWLEDNHFTELEQETFDAGNAQRQYPITHLRPATYDGLTIADIETIRNFANS